MSDTSWCLSFSKVALGSILRQARKWTSSSKLTTREKRRRSLRSSFSKQSEVQLDGRAKSASVKHLVCKGSASWTPTPARHEGQLRGAAARMTCTGGTVVTSSEGHNFGRSVFTFHCSIRFRSSDSRRMMTNKELEGL